MSEFPPSAPQSLQKTLPSYPYKEYDDDEDIVAFIDSYNEYTQRFVDWFNTINLPIYTDKYDALTPGLLNLIGQGLYGIDRPGLFSNRLDYIGPIDTYALNEPPVLAGTLTRDTVNYQGLVTDDVYKRVLTWHLYKGDGRQIGAQWIKRRVNRFLNGVAGGPYEGDRSQISAVFSSDDQGATRITELINVTAEAIPGGFAFNELAPNELDLATTLLVSPGTVRRQQLAITIITGISRLVRGAVADTFAFNELAANEADVSVSTLPTPALASVFKQAIDDGVLELPFMYTVTCRVGVMGI